MIVPGTPPVRGALRSAHAQSSRKRTAIVAAAFSLVTAFVLAGAPTAIAAPAVPAFTNNHVTSISDFHSVPCRGKQPGVCRNSPDMQSDGSGQVPDGYNGDADGDESMNTTGAGATTGDGDAIS